MFKSNETIIWAQVASTYKENTHVLVLNDKYL